jgi:hypothetical protein
MFARILTLAVFGFCTVGCDGAEPAERTPLAETQTASGSATKEKPSAAKSAAVSFAKDVLPILKSRTEGKVYKCVICHPDYEKLDNVRKPDVIKDVIRSMEEGSMPIGGTQVAESDIALLKKWVKDGYKP